MKIKILLLFALSLVFLSCSKDEGYGGLATVQGKIFAKNYNSSGYLVSEGYLGEVRVYISKHGDATSFDDKRTSYDGSFKFEYLQEGTYDVWAFGDCDSCTWSQNYVVKTVEVSSRKANVSMEDIIITF
jgi:hypothetical protein